ncbi:aminotransferase class III-fold pyridoxal phosphate-dependent enzyme [Lentzea sp. BCCO 10_0856]|uniref:Aminotransferase class III-fold pyridoxal phosphate-dependent enzyme n=1 Tax=Lentzea miocenica TaxID=3095431 RepID=A0ABU4TEX3_9PSEU|nr:aminotransferase class III-fold pyridoxal phosphate-dependent enzyme [Lentzea sp. BCCO 10_0856]MDX8036727.1 aminotransferase class III-fold pyridoxal phosphate-dependent enzyme [Lentzea sp. BCCO 10_0856]
MTSVASETLRRYRAHLGKGRAALAELLGGEAEVASSGAWVHTDTGRKLLNCGGYGVLIMGSRHPRVVEEVTVQLATHPVSTRLFLEPSMGRAAEVLTSVVPDGLTKVHFANSGTEAVEAAVKMARSKGKRKLISAHGGYHGKTLGALSLTAKDTFQRPFQPLLPDVSHVAYGDADAVRAELSASPGECCVVLEPVQGEAGVVIPPSGYLKEISALCQEFGAFFVLDEIQTGMGRLGSWWGADAESITPDVLLTGKALGGGLLPVSAAVATEDAYSEFDRDPFLHTSTFSGSPLGMAAVIGAIAAVQEDGLVERARHLGAELLPELRNVVTRVLGDHVRDVRGEGLLIGLEFATPDVPTLLMVDLVAEGVVANHSLNEGHVLRFTPPAVLTGSDVAFLLDAVERAATKVARWCD